MTGPRETPQPQGLHLSQERKGCIAHTFVFSAFAPLAQKLLCDLAPCKLSRQGNPRGCSQQQGSAELGRTEL